ncbi:hypothetical protein AMTRI_Chr11g96480 [Amborella trichopoda]
MAVDDQAVITLGDSEEEIGMGDLVLYESRVNEQVSNQYQSDEVEDVVDPLSAMVLVEPIIPVASIPVKDCSVVHPFGVDDASIVGEEVDLYRSVFHDMGVDLDVPIAMVVQAIKVKNKAEKITTMEANLWVVPGSEGELEKL